MLSYPYTATLDTNDTWLIVFPDVPEATGVADTEAGVPAQALIALAVAFEIYVDQRRAFPLPSAPTAGQQSLALPALFAAKVYLANEMVRLSVRKADMARMLNIHRPQVDRLLDPLYSSKIETLESALAALGRQLVVSSALAKPNPHHRSNPMNHLWARLLHSPDIEIDLLAEPLKLTPEGAVYQTVPSQVSRTTMDFKGTKYAAFEITEGDRPTCFMYDMARDCRVGASLGPVSLTLHTR